MRTKITATHERVDDRPALIVHLKRRRSAACLDKPVPPKGHWQGVRLGGTTVVWLACILSEGDHRLSHVAPGGKEHRRPLSRGIGHQVKPRDLTDERLATVLDSLSVADHGAAFARALHQAVLRVSDVPGRVVRVETTTAAADVTPDGRCQLGHSQEHRPDLPPVKIAMAVRDPLGWPWTTTVVAGPTADAPRSLPESATVRQIARTTGLTSVGDCTMAALGTRAESVAHQDADVCPLSATQRPEAARDRVRAPVLRHALEPREIRLPHADGACDETDDPVASGLASTIEISAPEQSGPSQTWHERRWVVRSLACATSHEQTLRQRVTRAIAAINALDERQQGNQRWPDEAAASQAAATSMAHHRAAGLVHASVTTEGHAPVKRRDGTRPATTVPSERGRVCAASEEATLAQTVRRLGWRVEATQHPAAALSLAQGVAAYRRASLIEHGFGRLKGRALSLTPLCLQDAHRGVALVGLLRIAWRVVVWMPCVVRHPLQHAGATRKGLYPGQPGRSTAQPTTERMWWALRGVTRSRLTIDGTLLSQLTPLTPVHKRLLARMEVPLES